MLLEFEWRQIRVPIILIGGRFSYNLCLIVYVTTVARHY